MSKVNLDTTAKMIPYTVNWKFNNRSYTTTVNLLNYEGQAEEDIKNQLSQDEAIHINEIVITGFTRKMILHG